MRSGSTEATSGAATAWEAASAPFTERRSVEPSNVDARCVHVFSGTADDPAAVADAPFDTYASGTPEATSIPYGKPPPPRSLATTACHLAAEVGYTHASSVSAVVRSRAAESGTVTVSALPSNDRALPNRPAVDHVAPETEPVRPLPEASAAVAPVPASKP